MRSVIWLAWKEIAARKARLFVYIAVMGLSVALCVVMNFISRSRGQAVNAQMGNIGPELSVVPEGIDIRDLTNFDTKDRIIPENTVAEIRALLGSRVRRFEGRLLFKKEYKGNPLPVIGIEPDAASPLDTQYNIRPGEAALGWELAQILKINAGDAVQVQDRVFRVKHILQSNGNIEDAAMFILLKEAQALSKKENSVNEIRLFPTAGTTADSITSALKAGFAGLNIIRFTEAMDAAQKVDSKLELYKSILYGFTAIVVALILMIESYLNSSERKIEMAVLYAIGNTGAAVLQVLLFRAIFIGLMGSVAGYALGAVIALAQDYTSGLYAVKSLDLLTMAVSAAIGISILATLPVSIAASYSDHVKKLQED